MGKGGKPLDTVANKGNKIKSDVKEKTKYTYQFKTGRQARKSVLVFYSLHLLMYLSRINQGNGDWEKEVNREASDVFITYRSRERGKGGKCGGK